MHLSPYSPKTCDAVFKREPHSLSLVKSLHIEGYGTGGYDPLFYPLLRRFVDEKVQIQTLILSHWIWSHIGDDAASTLKNLFPIRQLTLSNFVCTVEDFHSLISSFPSLTQLCIDAVRFVNSSQPPAHLPIALRERPRLQSLSIGCGPRTLADVTRAIGGPQTPVSLATLKELEVWGSITPTAEVVAGISSLLKSPGVQFKSAFRYITPCMSNSFTEGVDSHR